MSTRYHKAVLKAEKAYDVSLAEAKAANDEWVEASRLVVMCRKEFVQKNPGREYDYFDDTKYKKLARVAYAYYDHSKDLKAKAIKLRGVMELKDRQLTDFLARCPRNCVCRGPDTGAMVQCDGCKNWFHLTCAKLTEEEAQALPRFDCLMCVRMPLTSSTTESLAPSSLPNIPAKVVPHSQ